MARGEGNRKDRSYGEKCSEWRPNRCALVTKELRGIGFVGGEKIERIERNYLWAWKSMGLM